MAIKITSPKIKSWADLNAGLAHPAESTPLPTPAGPASSKGPRATGILAQLTEVSSKPRLANFAAPTTKRQDAEANRPKNFKIVEQFTNGRTRADNVRRVTTWGIGTSDLAESLAAVKLMKDAGVEPDSLIYNALLAKCERVRNAEEALRVVGEMRDRGMVLDQTTYELALSICARSGDIDNALDFFNQMRAAGLVPDANIYNTILSACLKADKAQDLMLVIKDMRAARVAPNTMTDSLMTAVDERS